LFNEFYTAAAILYSFGGLTDILDGYIARKFNMITSWGKLADPVADKLMQITAIMLLTIQKKLPIIVLIIVAAKEAFMGLGSFVIYKKKNIVVSANWYGKMATVIFYFAIIMIIFDVRYSEIFVGLAVFSTLFAFFMYSMSYAKIKKSVG